MYFDFANLLMMQFDAILETLCNSDFAKKRTLDKNVISTWLLDACRYSIFITDNNNFYKSSFKDYSNYKIPTNLLHSTTIIMKNRKKICKIASLQNLSCWLNTFKALKSCYFWYSSFPCFIYYSTIITYVQCSSKVITP